jgi:hypothetical protein
MTREIDQVTTIADALQMALDSQRSEIHVAMPGRIVEYDATHRTATVRPQHLRAVKLEDGTYEAEQLPDIYDVPVLFPRCGDYGITLPVSVDDGVLLLFPHEDPGRWRSTGQVSDPGDRRLHHIAGAVAIPGFYPTAETPSHPNDRIRISHGGIVTDFTSTHVAIAGGSERAALASAVYTQLVAIQTAIGLLGGSYTAPVSASAIGSTYVRTGG